MTDQLEHLKVALANRYTVERELGRGGMARVYLAEDLKHGRQVALKVLRPELTAALGAERFLQEIRVTATLQHPHILPLYDSGNAAGHTAGQAFEFLYYVMPYVEGESLRDRLRRERQLPVEDAVRISEQVASALDFAHRRDVIHRDIKPENILLHEGVAMVADFGIALAMTAAGGERLTETGLSIGTPEYMSPEQVAGERRIDGRSDVYSLACVLYEMLAGQPPFTAATGQAVLARHVTDPVPAITTVRPGVTPPMAAAITKALGKAPADRFPSAAAFAEGLRADTVDAEQEAIVVLPFENLSPDPENEYFSDGLTEEIITDLSKIRSLRVISRNSAMQFKGTKKDTRTIGRELGVQYVLEGSVRKAANRLRITAQLIDAGADRHLWAEKYDGVLDDVFAMQEGVSRAIAEALKLTLGPEEERHLGSHPIENVQAYQCYLRARQDSWLATPDALARAEELLKAAYDIIGDNALLHAGMGYVYWWRVNAGLEHEDHIALVEDYAQRALALDSQSAEAHLLLGLVYQAFRGDQARSFHHLKTALATRPDDADTLLWLVVGHSIVGRLDEARLLAQRLLAVDPLTPISRFVDVFVDVFSGQLDHPVDAFTSWLRMECGSPAALLFAAWFLALAGRPDELRRTVEGNADAEAEDVFTLGSLMALHAVDGHAEEVRALMTEGVRKTGRRDPQFSHYMADIHALAGMHDEALEWLANALTRGWVNYPFTVLHDPLLAPLRDDSRFGEIAERMRQQWQEFEV
jgi:serine/threonine protein kinase